MIFFTNNRVNNIFKRNADPQPFKERYFLDVRFKYDSDSKLVYIPNANFLLSELLRNVNKFHFGKRNAQGQPCGFDFVYYMVFLVSIR